MAAALQHRYEKDYYGWLIENVDLLRRGKVSEIDINNIAEELEGMSKSEKHQLMARLAILMAHLLKWEFQPSKRSNSWRATIQHQRLRIKRLLEESPSLKHALNEKLTNAYQDALMLASEETHIVIEDFPSDEAYTLEQLMDDTFFPE